MAQQWKKTMQVCFGRVTLILAGVLILSGCGEWEGGRAGQSDMLQQDTLLREEEVYDKLSKSKFWGGELNEREMKALLEALAGENKSFKEGSFRSAQFAFQFLSKERKNSRLFTVEEIAEIRKAIEDSQTYVRWGNTTWGLFEFLYNLQMDGSPKFNAIKDNIRREIIKVRKKYKKDSVIFEVSILKGGEG